MDEELEYTMRADKRLARMDKMMNSANRDIYHLGKTHGTEEVTSEFIFERLCEDLVSVTFGDYLKRYIYKKWNMECRYEDTSLNDYVAIIKESLHKTGTPYSIEETSEKEAARIKRYLTQNRMERKNVFLLGFGLEMDVSDVEELLTKGLKEKGINFKDPFEVICWYCLKKKYNYLKFQGFYGRYNRFILSSSEEEDLYEEKTMNYKRMLIRAKDDEELIDILERYNLTSKPKISKTAYENFCIKYEKAKEQVSLFFDNEIASENITPGKIEDVLYSAIPKSNKGNRTLPKIPHSPDLLNEISGHLLTRQRIQSILNGDVDVTRIDLITIAFLVHALKEENEVEEYASMTSKARYNEFIDETNKLLETCNFTPLLATNPYECFILLCILSDCPIDMFESIVEEAVKTTE